MIPDEAISLGIAALGGAFQPNPPRWTNHIACEVHRSNPAGAVHAPWPQMTWPWSPVGAAATALILRTLRRHQTLMIQFGSSSVIVALHRCLWPQTEWHHPPHLPPRADFWSVSPSRDAVVFYRAPVNEYAQSHCKRLGWPQTKGKERFSQNRERYSVCVSASTTAKTEAGLLSSPNQCTITLSASGCVPDTKHSPPAPLPAGQSIPPPLGPRLRARPSIPTISPAASSTGTAAGSVVAGTAASRRA